MLAVRCLVAHRKMKVVADIMHASEHEWRRGRPPPGCWPRCIGDVGREVQSLAVRGVEGYLVGDGGREV